MIQMRLQTAINLPILLALPATKQKYSLYFLHQQTNTKKTKLALSIFDDDRFGAAQRRDRFIVQISAVVPISIVVPSLAVELLVPSLMARHRMKTSEEF